MHNQSQTLCAPKWDCLHGTVDGLRALIWEEENTRVLRWCWLSPGYELLETRDQYVGVFRQDPPETAPITWRRIGPGQKVVVNGRTFPWIEGLSQGQLHDCGHEVSLTYSSVFSRPDGSAQCTRCANEMRGLL